MNTAGFTNPRATLRLDVPQISKNMRRHVRQHVAPTEISERPKGPVDYAVSERCRLELRAGAALQFGRVDRMY